MVWGGAGFRNCAARGRVNPELRRGAGFGGHAAADDSRAPVVGIPLMKVVVVFLAALLAGGAVSCRQVPSGGKSFQVKGVFERLTEDAGGAIIRHEEIPGYMDAMTMAFHARNANEIAQLRPGDEITFRLVVKEDESWIEQVVRTGGRSHRLIAAAATNVEATAAVNSHPLMQYAFTNELGEPVTLAGFKGQALAITFFFTRCPIPEYCPRLSKNFEEASQELLSMPNAPTNWHLLSVTIDPQFDTPAMLRSYGKRYHYNPKHWSFLTGPPDQVAELARQSGVTWEPDQGLLNHNFRTLIINPAGQLHMNFPIGGDISDGIVEEILKAIRSAP